MANTTVSYKCPHCTAPLNFQPGKETISCEYCGTEFETAAIKALFEREQERAAKAAEAEQVSWDTSGAGTEWSDEEAGGLQKFTCSSCGAELVCDENTMATECCYCGNPTMIPSRFEGALMPDYVIPFQKTKKEAVAALKEFYKGKTLLPKAFTANNRVENIQPMYVPFWLFDSKVFSTASFRAETDHIYDTPDETITETRVYACERAGSMAFRSIPVDGSKKMDDSYMESIEPFDYSNLAEFNGGYLAGYLADRYDVDAEESVPRADKRMESSSVGVLQGTVTGYDRVSLTDHVVSKTEGKVTYALAPVWILTTRYQGKPYTFMMNGQTGKMAGSLPYDKVKSWLYPGAAGLIAAPFIYYVLKVFMA